MLKKLLNFAHLSDALNNVIILMVSDLGVAKWLASAPLQNLKN